MLSPEKHALQKGTSDRPDLAQSDPRDDDRKIIVDTKWKVPGDQLPGDEDLRQMFAWNHLFGCQESILKKKLKKNSKLLLYNYCKLMLEHLRNKRFLF